MLLLLLLLVLLVLHQQPYFLLLLLRQRLQPPINPLLSLFLLLHQDQPVLRRLVLLLRRLLLLRHDGWHDQKGQHDDGTLKLERHDAGAKEFADAHMAANAKELLEEKAEAVAIMKALQAADEQKSA